MSYVPAISQMSISAEQAYGSVSAISGFVAVSIAMMNSQRKTIDYYTSIIQKKIDIINALRDVKNHFGMDKGGENDKVDDKSNKATDVSSGAVRAYLEGKHYSKDVINTVLNILDPKGSGSIDTSTLSSYYSAISDTLADIYENFTTIDSDFDGKLSIGEIKAYLKDGDGSLSENDQRVLDFVTGYKEATKDIDFSKENINKMSTAATFLSKNTNIDSALMTDVLNILKGHSDPLESSNKDDMIGIFVNGGVNRERATALVSFYLDYFNTNGADHGDFQVPEFIKDMKILKNEIIDKVGIPESTPDQGFTISKDDLNQRVQDAVETLQSENQINLIKFQAAIRNFETTVNAASQTIATDKQISLQIGGRI